jgi:hypothetical protein
VSQNLQALEKIQNERSVWSRLYTTITFWMLYAGRLAMNLGMMWLFLYIT